MRKENEAIKDRIIRDNKDLFEHNEGNYFKETSFGVTIILNTKVTVIKIQHYQLKNILIKLVRI